MADPPRPSREPTRDGVRLASPPPTAAIRPAWVRLNVGTRLVRIYAPDPYGIAATTFRTYGPLDARFDHQRGSRRNPADDPDRGVLYAALTFACALGERFGDEGQIGPLSF